MSKSSKRLNLVKYKVDELRARRASVLAEIGFWSGCLAAIEEDLEKVIEEHKKAKKERKR